MICYYGFMRIALATNQEYPDLIGGDVLLLEAFRKAGYEAHPAIWNDPSVDWTQFDHVVIRSCWGYHKQIAAFHVWLDKLANHGSVVHNTPDIIRWNSHKKYLFDLQTRGVAIPPTALIVKDDSRSLAEITESMPGESFIIKPCYGASAYGVTKVERRVISESRADPAFLASLRTNDVLVQAFIPEVVTGETSAVFIRDVFSHAVLKTPSAGEFRSNSEFGGTKKRIELDADMRAAVEKLYALCSIDVLYARLDFIATETGILLMELELIEPYLYFDLEPASSQRFVDAFRHSNIKV